jgi:hypothetical protein
MAKKPKAWELIAISEEAKKLTETLIHYRDHLISVGTEAEQVSKLYTELCNNAWNENPKIRRPDKDEPIPLFPPPRLEQLYPIEALGPILSEAASAIAHKVQVPLSLAAQSVLAYAALAVQALANIQPPQQEQLPTSLWAVTLAESGDRKTGTDLLAGTAIRKFETELRIKYINEARFYDINLATYELGKKQADKERDPQKRKELLEKLPSKPQPPLQPLLTAPDPTIEALFKLWPRLPASLGLFTDEGAQFTGGYGMNKDNRMKTAAALSGLFYKGEVRRLRATDNEITILNGRRLSIHAMIQVELGKKFIGSEDLNDQGFLSRFLVAYPTSLKGTRLPQQSDPRDDIYIETYENRLLTLLRTQWPLNKDHALGLDPYPLTLNDEAKQLWDNWRAPVELKLLPNGDYVPISGLASKAAELAMRIAGVQTVIAGRVIIEDWAIHNGTRLMNWYLNEALRINETYSVTPQLLNAQKLLDWLYTVRKLKIDFRYIQQNGPNKFRSKADLEPLIAILIDHKWIIELTKRPRRFYLWRALLDSPSSDDDDEADDNIVRFPTSRV